MDLASQSMWIHFLVGCLFTGLIVFGPLLALLVYPLLLIGATWTTFVRKTYVLPDYREHPSYLENHPGYHPHPHPAS